MDSGHRKDPPHVIICGVYGSNTTEGSNGLNMLLQQVGQTPFERERVKLVLVGPPGMSGETLLEIGRCDAFLETPLQPGDTRAMLERLVLEAAEAQLTVRPQTAAHLVQLAAQSVPLTGGGAAKRGGGKRGGSRSNRGGRGRGGARGGGRGVGGGRGGETQLGNKPTADENQDENAGVVVRDGTWRKGMLRPQSAPQLPGRSTMAQRDLASQSRLLLGSSGGRGSGGRGRHPVLVHSTRGTRSAQHLSARRREEMMRNTSWVVADATTVKIGPGGQGVVGEGLGMWESKGGRADGGRDAGPGGWE
jgi:hypothetical protein